MKLATINAIWIGPQLGRVHAACLRSFVRQGHRTVLHVYDPPTDVPEGVQLSDAGELLPPSRIIRYSRSGSPAIFANLLRYEIQKKNLGLYVDCDCFCLGPIEDAESIYGWEGTGSINNAVLKLPSNSPALKDLLAIKDSTSFIPPWFSKKRRRYYQIRAMVQRPVKIQDMPWGVTGPDALTWYLKQYGLDEAAAPIDVFYPIHWDQVALLLDPDLAIEDITTSRTVLLHLYANKLQDFDLEVLAPTSPLAAILSA